MARTRRTQVFANSTAHLQSPIPGHPYWDAQYRITEKQVPRAIAKYYAMVAEEMQNMFYMRLI